jgi:hypothetical protein
MPLTAKCGFDIFFTVVVHLHACVCCCIEARGARSQRQRVAALDA